MILHSVFTIILAVWGPPRLRLVGWLRANSRRTCLCVLLVLFAVFVLRVNLRWFYQCMFFWDQSEEWKKASVEPILFWDVLLVLLVLFAVFVLLVSMTHTMSRRTRCLFHWLELLWGGFWLIGCLIDWLVSWVFWPPCLCLPDCLPLLTLGT